MERVLERLLGLGWRIEAASPFWAQAVTGNSWGTFPAKVNVLLSPRGSTVSMFIDIRARAAFGPFAKARSEKYLTSLCEALGVGSVGGIGLDSTHIAVGVPLARDHFSRSDWDALNEAASSSHPRPGRIPETTRQVIASGGGGEMALPVRPLVKWVVKEVGGALIAMGVDDAVHELLDATPGGHVRTGKLEYQPSTNDVVIKWNDGTPSTLAPPEYQPWRR